MQRLALALALAVITLLAAAGDLRAFDCVDYADTLQPQGQIPIDQEYPTELHVVGDAAYSIAADDPFVAVYDVSDPAQPLELAPLPLPAAPTGLATSDQWLLVTVPDLGLVRFDLADPLAPVADDTLDLGVDLPDVAMDGDLAAVSTVGGVRVIGLDFPSGMVALGTYATGSAVNALAIDGDRLYLATFGDGLVVLDAGDPTWLQPVGTASFPRPADRVAAEQGLAVLVGRGPGNVGWTAAAYEVGGDAPPQLRDSIDVAFGFYYSVVPTIIGPERVVIASRGAGLYDFDLSSLQFAPIGFLPGKHADFHQDATRYLVLTESKLTAGLPGPFPPAPIWTTGAGQQSVEDDDYVFSTYQHNLDVVQVDSPDGPELIGGTNLGGPVSARLSMALHGLALYVGDSSENLAIIDIYNLRQPRHVADRSLPADATGLVAGDGVLYVLMQGWGLATYDLADVLAPQHIATFGVEIGSHRGAVKLGDQLLVATESSGVDVFDVSDPAAVTLVDNLPGRNYISDLALAGDRLLVTDRVQSVQVWQPAAGSDDWTLLGTVPPSRILDAAVGGDVAYLRHEFGDVYMLDLRGTGVPEVVATLPTGFVSDGGLVAGDDWVSVRWGADHRIFPAPCLLDITAAPRLPAPTALALEAAPNPFNPRTRLSFALERPGEVQLRVYDLRGRHVDTLLDGPLAAGRHHADWRGTDQAGRPLPSGVYHARLTAAGATVSRKISLLK